MQYTASFTATLNTTVILHWDLLFTTIVRKRFHQNNNFLTNSLELGDQLLKIATRDKLYPFGKTIRIVTTF